jgi:cytochrome b6-f complex iron-sulfur subunit
MSDHGHDVSKDSPSGVSPHGGAPTSCIKARHRRRRGVADRRRGAASLRSLVPNVSYDAPTTVKLGNPVDFPDGIKFLPDERLFVFRTGQDVPRDLRGVHPPRLHGARRGAVQAQETPRSAAAEPCGSPTASTARVTAPATRATARTISGPAPKALAWYHLSVRDPTTASSSSTSPHEVATRLPPDDRLRRCPCA